MKSADFPETRIAPPPQDIARHDIAKPFAAFSPNLDFPSIFIKEVPLQYTEGDQRIKSNKYSQRVYAGKPYLAATAPPPDAALLYSAH